MTNALRPSELFGLPWKRFNYKDRTMTIAETVNRGKIRSTKGKTKKSLGVVHLAKSWPRSSPLEATVSRQLSRCVHFCEQTWRFSLFEQLSHSGTSRACRRVEIAESDLSNHSPFDCDLGATERYGEGCAGPPAALRGSNHDRCVHAGNSRRRAQSTPSTRNYEKSAGKKGWKGGLKKICYQFASKCYQAERMMSVSA